MQKRSFLTHFGGSNTHSVLVRSKPILNFVEPCVWHPHGYRDLVFKRGKKIIFERSNNFSQNKKKQHFQVTYLHVNFYFQPFNPFRAIPFDSSFNHYINKTKYHSIIQLFFHLIVHQEINSTFHHSQSPWFQNSIISFIHSIIYVYLILYCITPLCSPLFIPQFNH